MTGSEGKRVFFGMKGAELRGFLLQIAWNYSIFLGVLQRNYKVFEQSRVSLYSCEFNSSFKFDFKWLNCEYSVL